MFQDHGQRSVPASVQHRGQALQPGDAVSTVDSSTPPAADGPSHGSEQEGVLPQALPPVPATSQAPLPWLPERFRAGEGQDTFCPGSPAPVSLALGTLSRLSNIYSVLR